MPSCFGVVIADAMAELATQSSSLVGVKGFDGRRGLGTCPCFGGSTDERTGRPIFPSTQILCHVAWDIPTVIQPPFPPIRTSRRKFRCDGVIPDKILVVIRVIRLLTGGRVPNLFSALLVDLAGQLFFQSLVDHSSCPSKLRIDWSVV